MRAGAGRPLIKTSSLSPDRRVLSLRARPRFFRAGAARKTSRASGPPSVVCDRKGGRRQPEGSIQ